MSKVKILLVSFLLVLFQIEAKAIKDFYCNSADDCMPINSSCSNYSDIAISKKFKKKYESKLYNKCKNFKGQSTSMAEGGPVQIICEKNECQIKLPHSKK